MPEDDEDIPQHIGCPPRRVFEIRQIPWFDLKLPREVRDTKPRIGAAAIPLVNSIKQHGIMNPLIVVEDYEDGWGFTVLDGVFRFDAGKHAGFEEFPCVVLDKPPEDFIKFKRELCIPRDFTKFKIPEAEDAMCEMKKHFRETDKKKQVAKTLPEGWQWSYCFEKTPPYQTFHAACAIHATGRYQDTSEHGSLPVFQEVFATSDVSLDDAMEKATTMIREGKVKERPISFPEED